MTYRVTLYNKIQLMLSPTAAVHQPALLSILELKIYPTPPVCEI